MYVMKRTTLGPEEICSFIIGDACDEVDNPTHEWQVVFPPVPKPALVEPVAPKVKFPTFFVSCFLKDLSEVSETEREEARTLTYSNEVIILKETNFLSTDL